MAMKRRDFLIHSAHITTLPLISKLIPMGFYLTENEMKEFLRVRRGIDKRGFLSQTIDQVYTYKGTSTFWLSSGPKIGSLITLNKTNLGLQFFNSSNQSLIRFSELCKIQRCFNLEFTGGTSGLKIIAFLIEMLCTGKVKLPGPQELTIVGGDENWREIYET